MPAPAASCSSSKKMDYHRRITIWRLALDATKPGTQQKAAFHFINCLDPAYTGKHGTGEIDHPILLIQVNRFLPPQENLSGLLGLSTKGKYCS